MLQTSPRPYRGAVTPRQRWPLTKQSLLDFAGQPGAQRPRMDTFFGIALRAFTDPAYTPDIRLLDTLERLLFQYPDAASLFFTIKPDHANHVGCNLRILRSNSGS